MTPKRGPNPETPVTGQIRAILDMMRVAHFKHWSGPFSEKGVPDLIGVIPGQQTDGQPMTRTIAREMAMELENAKKMTDVQALVVLAAEVIRLRAEGRPLFCEVKVPGKDASEDQEKFLARMRTAGAVTFVAHSAREAVAELAKAGFQEAKRIEGQFEDRTPDE